MGAAMGGWDKALEMQLYLDIAANKKLNKLAWCYLTLSLQGEALDEMDMIPDKNAYDVWLHLKKKYKLSNEKSNEEFEIKSEKKSEAWTVCNQKRQIKQAEKQYPEKQEVKSGYCNIDLWNDNTEAGQEEAQNKECEDDEYAVSNNKENVNREENDKTEEFLEDPRYNCNAEDNV